METSCWNLLPADNLQQIFENLEIFDVEKCLLVCKDWYEEANFYLKDKVYFSTSHVVDIEDIIASKRRFQLIRATGINVTINEITNISDFSILKALSQRVMKIIDPILEAHIQYKDYPTLSKILQSLGKHVKSLNLVNFVNEAPVTLNERQGIFLGGLQREFATLDYGCLSSVDELKVFIIDNGLLNISRNFGNLKSLTLNSRFTMTQDFLSTTLLRDFIGLNPFLRKLHLLEGYLGLETDGGAFSVKTLLSFENARNLRALHLMTINNDQDLEDLGENFKQLEVLEIAELSDTHYNPRYVQRIFQLPNLKSLSILNSYLGVFWKDTFLNIKNFNITNLTLNGYDIEEGGLIACIKCLPNMKSFTCENITSFSLLFLKEMSKNWSQLQSLNLSFDEDSFRESDITDVCSFGKLVNLSFSQRFNDTLMQPFFACFKAGNLKNLILDILFCNEQNADDLQRNFALLSQNCPKIEYLKFTGKETDMEISILNNFPKLKLLHIYGWFENLYSDNSSIVNALESILSKKTATLKKIRFDLEYTPNLKDFCEAKGALAEYKEGMLKRILIENIEILFN